MKVTVETDRLFLRQMNEDDFDALHNSFTSRILNQKCLTDSITRFLPTGNDGETVVSLSRV